MDSREVAIVGRVMCIAGVSLRGSSQLGFEHLGMTTVFKCFAELRSATGHQVMSEGAIQLKVDTFGRQANLLVQVFRDMPGQLDMILGWPDTRRILDQPGKGQFGGFSKNLYSSMQEARRTAEKEDTVDLSRLEKPFSTMFPKEVLFMSSTMPGGNDVKKPKLECPCGYMSESEYEKVRRGDACIEAMKACKEIPHFTCDCGNRFTGKSIWLAHRKICHGDKKPFVCPVRGCFFDAVTICQAIEHARYHREWDAKRTTQVGEILLCSTVGNTISQNAELQSKNPLLKIHELMYGTHLEPEQLFALKRLFLKYEDLFGTEE
ncbi:hypothetical protein BV898_19912, partial [Hypsibius exemplaris]